MIFKRLVMAVVAFSCAVLPTSSTGQADLSSPRPAVVSEQLDQERHVLDIAAAL